MRSTMTIARHLAPALVAVLLAGNVSALAQPPAPLEAPATSGAPARKPPPAVAGGLVEFGDEPFHLDAVGMTMLVAVGCRLDKQELGDKATVQITPRDKSWIMNVITQRSTNPATTPAQVCDELVTQAMKAAGQVFDASRPDRLVGVQGEIVEARQAMKLAGGDAERVYIKTASPGGGAKLVRGYTIFKSSPTQFVTIELIAGEALFATARVPYEAMVGTATFDDPSAASESRAAAVAAGLKVIAGIDEATMREIVASRGERWERYYRPSPTGSPSDEAELGYRRIRVSIGSRASMEGGAGADDGYIVRLDARNLLNDPKGGAPRIADTQGVYFVSFDRSSEAWSVKLGVREKGRVVTSASEIGARSGTSMTVQIDATGQQTKQIRPVMQREGYVSRVDALLLGDFIVRSGVQADLACYAYQSDAETVRLRRDRLERPVESPGLQKLTTRLGEDPKRSQVSYFNEGGTFLRTEMPDGAVWEPVSVARLTQIWQSKGLPMN